MAPKDEITAQVIRELHILLVEAKDTDMTHIPFIVTNSLMWTFRMAKKGSKIEITDNCYTVITLPSWDTQKEAGYRDVVCVVAEIRARLSQQLSI